MLVVVNRLFGWSLGFYDPRWNLTPKAQIPIQMHFDGGSGFNVVGTVILPALVEVGMPDNSALINTFRRGLQMSAVAQNQLFAFDLNGTSRLMVQLVDCVRTELALETGQPSTPAAGPQSPPLSPNPSEETLLEETRLATGFPLAAQVAWSAPCGRDRNPGSTRLLWCSLESRKRRRRSEDLSTETTIDWPRFSLPGNRRRC